MDMNMNMNMNMNVNMTYMHMQRIHIICELAAFLPPNLLNTTLARTHGRRGADALWRGSSQGIHAGPAPSTLAVP